MDCGSEHAHTPSAHPGVPVVEHGLLDAAVTEREGGWMLDFGRCFSGVVRLVLAGPRGARVDIRHAEQLQDGELYLRGNRSAQAHDMVILSGEGEEVFQPEFTYHGFRYAHVKATGGVRLIAARGVMISSALPDPTCFDSGDETVNRAFQMILNTQQSNLFEMPTDVCARDERLGWGAEGHFFLHTATRLHCGALFLRKWMQDIADSQLESGCFWAIAPAVMMKDVAPFAGDLQSDMGIHVCWLLMTVYADAQTVRRHFPALERHFAFLVQNSDRLIRFAIACDWLDIGPDGHSDFDHGYGHCQSGLLGTAYFARAAQMMAEIAHFLGQPARAAHYEDMYGKIRSAFRTFFLQRDKRLRGATQGGYLAALAFGLLDEEEIPVARGALLEDFARNGHLNCGTATAPVALDGLCKAGLPELAARFLAKRSFPSLGYMLSQGATAVWERWDAIREGQYHPHPMNAFDHIGLATLGEWMIGGLVGIALAEPGMRVALLRPAPEAGIGCAEAAYQSRYGEVRARWWYEDGALRYRCRIPAGMKGRVELPGGSLVTVIKGEDGIEQRADEEAAAQFLVRAGEYEFRVDPEEQ